MSAKWPMVPLGEVAKPISRAVVVEPGTAYRTIGVKLWGEGAYERETIDGSRTAAKTLSVVHKNDLIINKIWVRHGSTAIATESVHGCSASGEFPTFELNRRRVEPRWIHWQTKMRPFWEKCDDLSRGTSGKNRIKPELFLTIAIPLPPIEEQRRIVARIESLAARIADVRDHLRLSIESLDALQASSMRVYFGEHSTDGWKSLSQFVSNIHNGWSPQCEPQPAAANEWGVLKVGAVSFGYFDEKQNKSLPPSLSPMPEYEIKSGDFLMSRANTIELVGACALVHRTRSRLILCDKIFRFDFKDAASVNRRYWAYLMKSPPLRRQIEHSASGTSPTMKNISKAKIMELLLPSHSTDEQCRIVAHFDELTAKVDSVALLQEQSAAELDALLPSILDRAFKGAL